MERHIIDSNWDRDNRNGLNKNFEYLFQGAQRVSDLSDEAENILEEAQQTNDMNENVQQQINTLVAESGTSDAEVVQARVDSEGTTHTVLKERLDKSDNIVHDSRNLLGWELQNKIREVKPMITFVDDDAYRNVLTHLVPLSEQYNIPFVVAAISDRVEKEVDYSLTAQELRDLQDMGWEISSHTHTHANLRDLSTDAQDEELRKSKNILESMGLNISTVCYPYGGTNEDTSKIVRKYYRAGRTTDYRGEMNLSPLETYDLLVTPLGSWFDTWGENPYPGDSLDFYKHQVDKAIENNAWLIFMTHVGGNDQHDETQQNYLEETIKYVLQNNIEVVTLDEGMNKRGNIIDIGRYYKRDLSKKHFVVGADGAYSGSELQNLISVTGTEEITADMPLTDIPLGHIYMTYHGDGVSAQHYPTTRGGVLTTDTSTQKTPLSDYLGMSFQEYKVRGKNEVWERYSINEDEWSEWKKQNSSIAILPANSVTADSPKDSFPAGQISHCKITSVGRDTFPESKGGLLTTNRILDDSYYVWQEYEQSEWEYKKYRRFWQESAQEWTTWKKYVFE